MNSILAAITCVALGIPLGAGVAGLVMAGAITRDNAPFAAGAVVGIVALGLAVWQIALIAIDGRRHARMAADIER